MIFGLIKRNTYQDSVNLMLLSSKLSSMDRVKKVSIMMGTPANKDIFKNTMMYSKEFDTANPNDICIAVESDDIEMVGIVESELDKFINELAISSRGSNISKVRSLESAMRKLENPNLALISIPGEYVFEEGNKLLDNNLNLFIFSDNVSLTEEKALKEKADKKGLIVMGPDCGTGIISNTPLAFANVVNKGNIGIVGASGTGIQEVSCLITRLGGGISHAIGIGGRDLAKEVGGLSALRALDLLEIDDSSEIVVFISKPPAEEVKEKIVSRFKMMNKKVIALFLGESGRCKEENVYFTDTLEETAYLAIYLSKKYGSYKKDIEKIKGKLDIIKRNEKQKDIHGYYGGGTLAGEAKLILKTNICNSNTTIIDFGDDEYTKGKPHPMIDPSTRIDAIRSLKEREDIAVVLFDNVIGYGSNTDMAGSLAPTINEVINHYKKNNREIIFIASVCGTEMDKQVYSKQVSILEESGVFVVDSNTSAAKIAKEAMEYLNNTNIGNEKTKNSLLNSKLSIINLGLESFSQTLFNQGTNVIQYNWSPIAGGDKEIQGLLKLLKDK